MTDVPESMEALTERLRRSAAFAADYELDEHLAVAIARRDVAAVHGRHSAAAAWQETALALEDVRRTRAEVAREVALLTAPPLTIRPLSAEELAEDAPEPPC